MKENLIACTISCVLFVACGGQHFQSQKTANSSSNGSQSNDANGQDKKSSGKTTTSQSNDKSDDKTDTPVWINGVNLVCSIDQLKSQNRVAVGCGLYKDSRTILSLEETGSINWLASNASEVTITPDINEAKAIIETEGQNLLDLKVSTTSPNQSPPVTTNIGDLLTSAERTCLQKNLAAEQCFEQSGRIVTKSDDYASEPAQFIQLTSGDDHRCAVSQTGGLYCWGDNSGRRLGFAEEVIGQTIEPSPKPVDISSLPDKVFIHVSSLEAHSCAVSLNGHAYCWGDNDAGEIGSGQSTNAEFPVQVNRDNLLANEKFIKVETGSNFSCGLTDFQNIYCWGSNLNRKLGIGELFIESFNSSIPVKVDSTEKFIDLDLGDQFACAINTSKKIFCWGRNNEMQLGNGTNLPIAGQSTPVQINSNRSFDALSLGNEHACAQSADRSYCWGSDEFQQDGIAGDNFDAESSPQLINPTGNTNGFMAVSAGRIHSCSLDTIGKAFCWGDSRFGQLGDGSALQVDTFIFGSPNSDNFVGSDSPKPVIWQNTPEKTFKILSAGKDNTCAITIDGETYCWGEYNRGQLGVDSADRAFNVPQLVNMTLVK